MCQGVQQLKAISLFTGVGGLEAGTKPSTTQTDLCNCGGIQLNVSILNGFGPLFFWAEEQNNL